MMVSTLKFSGNSAAEKSVLCRLMVIQGFKRCPFNMRRMAFVPKEYNAKVSGCSCPDIAICIKLWKIIRNYPKNGNVGDDKGSD